MSAQNFYEHVKELYGGLDEQPQQTEQPDLGNNENDELDSEITDSELKEAVFFSKKKLVKAAVKTIFVLIYSIIHTI